MTRKEKIMNGVKAHYAEALEYFPKDRILGIFLCGSQNYDLDTEESDIDTKLITLPSFDDIALNRAPVSTTHIIKDNNEHIDIKDLRLYINMFRKQNINFMEILFTDFKIINPKYADLWNILEERKEAIARYNEWKAVKASKGTAIEKYRNLEHRYPSRVEIVDKWGYDPKQLHHLLRIEDFLGKYVMGESYVKCLRPFDPKHLVSVKKGLYDLEQARAIAETAISNIAKMADNFINSTKDTFNINIHAILEEVQKDIMKRAIIFELEKEGLWEEKR